MKKLLILVILLIPFNVSAKKIDVSLSRCVDGDTAWFNLNKEEIKVRFLGIDAPESTVKGEEEPYGIEASNYVCKKLKNANNIKIEYDNKSDKVDRYNRHLAYVFVDDKLLETLVLKRGYASVKYAKESFMYYEDLIKAENYAKEKKLGIYSDEEILENEDEIVKNLQKFTKKYLKKLFSNVLRKIFN